MPEDKFNLDKLNASNAKLVKLDTNSKETIVSDQDQPVIATKSTTKLPTTVTTAVLDNTQEMDKEDNRTLDADLLLKTVINKDKFNLDNNNALHAKDAKLDTNLSVTNAKDPDQLVIAISNTIPPPISVTTVQ
jgi:hypothetical protein